MTNGRKPTEPHERMGVFKRLSDVPEQYRLRNYSSQFEGRDIWSEFAESYANGGVQGRTAASKSGRKRTARTGREWQDFMSNKRGRHHALATPKDVEAWAIQSHDKRALHTTYRVYWTRIETFFEWLQWRTDFPHVYHPALMAAAQYPATREIWQKKIGSWRGDND